MKTVVLIGSNRKQGATAKEALALARDLDPTGQDTVVHFANEMNVACCCGCEFCRREPACSQKDDMEGLIREILDSEAVVIASPVYFGALSGQLKTICDRLYPVYRGGGKSLVAGKKLYLVYTQHSACDTYADVRKTAENYLFCFLGFRLVQTTVVGKDGKRHYAGA